MASIPSTTGQKQGKLAFCSLFPWRVGLPHAIIWLLQNDGEHPIITRSTTRLDDTAQPGWPLYFEQLFI